jgi:phosphoglucosamine mutase
MNDAGRLTDNTLVATVMSNLGLKIALRDAGITVRETGVGDRYVLEEMRDGGYSLGGEQSGHVIFADYATTGDGVLTGLQLAAQVAATGRSLKDLAGVMTKLPQVLINVKGVDRSAVATDAGVQQAVSDAQALLGETGRVLLRPSGTEPVVRVMVEAADMDTAQRVAGQLAETVKARLALQPAPAA